MAADVAVRPIGPADLAALDTLLRAHLETSLFILSNLEAGGLEDRGEAYQATWIGAFEGPRVTAVAGSCWNGIVLVQGDRGVEAAARESVARSGRAPSGIAGPWPLVLRTRSALGLDDAAVAHGGAEDLFVLELDALRVPRPLADGTLRCRPPNDDEIEPLLVDWRTAYRVETLGAAPSERVRDAARGDLVHLSALGRHWVLEADDTPVSYSAFNAWARDVVQVGGVWTPPELRGRGYGRAVVAGSLLAARDKGATRSVLFTEPTNVPAQRAYRSLGYQQVGQYGLMEFR